MIWCNHVDRGQDWLDRFIQSCKRADEKVPSVERVLFLQRLINDVVIITNKHAAARTPTKDLADVNTERKSIEHRATVILSVLCMRVCNAS